MPELEEISYTTDEVRSILPLGWSLESGSEQWDEASEIWQATVRDGSDLTWPVRVGLAEARRSGRIEALRQATRETKHRRFA